MPVHSAELLAREPDRQILSDENSDVTTEVLSVLGETFGKSWLQDKNPLLSLRPPQDLIGTVDEYRIRDILRSFRSVGLS